MFAEIVCIVLIFQSVYSNWEPNVLSAEDDLVTQPLYGQQFQATFKQYAGYLNVTHQHQYFYWLMESQNNPEKDPLVLWLNGGPGCPSLQGALTENGPYRINEQPDMIYMTENIYSWNKIANILYIDSPAGVGFSYNGDGAIYSDTLTGIEDHTALMRFFEKHPNFKKRDFFISGESYAGVYLPVLATNIINDTNFPANFKGMLLGNGLFDSKSLLLTHVDFLNNHGFYTRDWFAKLKTTCKCPATGDCNYFEYATWNSTKSVFESLFLPQPTNECAKLIFEGQQYIFSYDFSNKNIIQSIYYGIQQAALSYNSNSYLSFADQNPEIPFGKSLREALHVPDYVQQDNLFCSMNVTETFVRDLSVYPNTMKPQIEKVISANKPILFYNGDLDWMCNYMSAERFIYDDLKLTRIGERKPWLYQNMLFDAAGFHDKFENNVDFVTIKGSGHMVPRDKPRESLQMFANFLAGQRNYSTWVNVSMTPAPPLHSTTTTSTQPSSASENLGSIWIFALILVLISIK